MSEKKEKIKIEFAPGCFDTFTGTQEELDELVKTLQNMSMEDIIEQSEPVDLDDMDADELDHVLSALNQTKPRNLN
jgi:hypothetical protein